MLILQHCLAAPRAVVYVAAARGRSGLGDSNHGVLGQAFPTAGGTLHGQGEVKYESILLVLMA